MSAVLTVEEAQSNLKDLIDQLAPGEEIVITKNQQPVAKLIRDRLPLTRPAPGLGKGSILYMAPDFDEPLEEFKEYMMILLARHAYFPRRAADENLPVPAYSLHGGGGCLCVQRIGATCFAPSGYWRMIRCTHAVGPMQA